MVKRSVDASMFEPGFTVLADTTPSEGAVTRTRESMAVDDESVSMAI